MTEFAVDPRDAVAAARDQHAALYLDTIEVFQPVESAGTRYVPRTTVNVTQGTTPALVQRAANVAGVVESAAADRLLSRVVIKVPLGVDVRPGWIVRVTAAALTPELVGREFRVEDDTLQTFAVTKRFYATQSTPAGVRP